MSDVYFNEHTGRQIERAVTDVQRMSHDQRTPRRRRNMNVPPKPSDSTPSTTSIWPAKISGYNASTDTHSVDIYANGFDETATETDRDLDAICNLAANEELFDDGELFVLKASDEYIGLINGIF